MDSELVNSIFSVSERNFDQVAIDVFRFQSHCNPVYRKYLELLRINAHDISEVEKIPFLPISFFKTQRVLAEGYEPQVSFTSSGTTGKESSIHFVPFTKLYEESFLRGFTHFYGDPSKYCILALLPSYLERQGSSLVFMVKELINRSESPQSGFFLNNLKDLLEVLGKQVEAGKPTILIGVTYALLDLARNNRIDLQETIIMETGGMKGRGKELVREELHTILKKAFSVESIHSEYGMTELLSQAYSKGDGFFQTPPWMKIFIRDPYDPFHILPEDRSGAINIIDLANLYSCSFIQTDDLGIIHSNGSFEVLGRMEGSQIRGCNLLVF